MPRENLRTSLDKLRAELASDASLNAATRKQLEEIASSIEQVLAESDPDYRETLDRIENAALGFEARHPAFARVLSEVTDALAKLGI